MIKRLLLILLVLSPIISYSQSRRPKSAKKKITIQDVVEEKKSPEEILKEVYKARLDSASQFSYSCMQYLVETKLELDSVRKANQTLYVIIDRQLDSLAFARNKEKRAMKIMLKEHYKKRAWAKAFAGETVLVAGVVGAIITGAWVPIGMGVFMFETFLILEGRYNNAKLEKEKNKTERYKF
jgi:hypothetical protein